MKLPNFPLPTDHANSRYAAVRGVSRRARMLFAGMPPLVDSDSRKPCRIAVEEHRAKLLSFTIKPRGRLLVMPAPGAQVPSGEEEHAKRA